MPVYDYGHVLPIWWRGVCDPSVRTDFAFALKVAERIRRVVERHSFGTKNRFSGTPLTLRLGVAGLSSVDDLRPEELLKLADDALYRSKEGGRNRVTPSLQDAS